MPTESINRNVINTAIKWVQLSVSLGREIKLLALSCHFTEYQALLIISHDYTVTVKYIPRPKHAPSNFSHSTPLPQISQSPPHHHNFISIPIPTKIFRPHPWHPHSHNPYYHHSILIKWHHTGLHTIQHNRTAGKTKWSCNNVGIHPLAAVELDCIVLSYFTIPH